MFRDYEPDLVVLDVMMPKLDGYGVCQELRKDSDVPIVMLTALGDVADRITGLELGADDYVVKPFSRGEILKEVWGYTPERHVDTRVVDVHISRLRSKLEADPANPELILTARGTGYLFQRIVDIAPFEGN